MLVIYKLVVTTENNNIKKLLLFYIIVAYKHVHSSSCVFDKTHVLCWTISICVFSVFLSIYITSNGLLAYSILLLLLLLLLLLCS